MNTAEIVKTCRTAAGISKSELARRVGVCPQSVCNWELGHKCPTADKLILVCRATGFEMIIKPTLNGLFYSEGK